ncbi:MAG TPA: hypothetical protein VEC94_05915, partial [Pseudolabrys sp.]|nr:hypothetical protein [Pseudolabrys sp.]
SHAVFGSNQEVEMRKVLIVAMGLASLSAFVGIQATPANASCVTTCVGWGLYPVVSNGKTTEHPYCRNKKTECSGQGPGPVQPIQQNKLRKLN